MKTKVFTYILSLLVLTAGIVFIGATARNYNEKIRQAGEILIVKNGNNVDIYHIKDNPDGTTSVVPNLDDYVLSKDARNLCLSEESGIYYSKDERSVSFMKDGLPLIIILLLFAIIVVASMFNNFVKSEMKWRRAIKRAKMMENEKIENPAKEMAE
jgi:hypothetical protein